jgi:hypothetical protein
VKRLLIVAALAAPLAQAAYKCTDEKGKSHFGDTPPAACATVVMYEISRTGLVLRKIDPTPTPEQIKAREEEEARQREAARAADDQRRKDLALLATYTGEKDFDIARDRNLEPIHGRLRISQERLKSVEKRIQELEDELEFYKAGKSKTKGAKDREAPPQLTADYERSKNEKAHIVSSMAGYEKEIEQVRSRYEADKLRYRELKKMQSEGKLDLRDPRVVEAQKKNDAGKPAVKRYNLYLVPAN